MLSPSTATVDRTRKLPLYHRDGVVDAVPLGLGALWLAREER